MGNYGVNRYKFISVPRARKLGLLANIRGVQRLVLSYAVNINIFSASDVVVFYGLKNKYGDDANKRVHDAIKRLERRGVVERVGWGLYRLKVDVSSVLGTRKVYDVGVGGVGFGGGVGGVLRLHVRPVGGGVVGFYVRLLVVRFGLLWALRFVEGELLRVYGRGFVRRLRRLVRRGVCVRGGVVGCHGRFGRREPWLLPINYVDECYVSEVGVDLLSKIPLDKLFLKVYFRRMGADKKLDEYINALEETINNKFKTSSC